LRKRLRIRQRATRSASIAVFPKRAYDHWSSSGPGKRRAVRRKAAARRRKIFSAPEGKDAPPGASLPPGPEKFFRGLAVRLRRTPLLPPGHNELRWLYTRLEGTAREALLVALWRMRRRFRNPSHLFIVAELVVQRIRQNPWCWGWWRERGVRAAYALLMRWAREAFWLSERVCLASEDLPRGGRSRLTLGPFLFGCPGWGSFQRGLAHGALGVVLAPSPGGEGRWM